MNACTELEILVSLHAARALDPAEAGRVEAHLEACAACRAEAERAALALDLAALPPVSERERAALVDLPARTLAALRRSEDRRGLARRVLVGVAAAAAAAAVVLAPAVLRKDPPAPAPARSTAEVVWQVPDLDVLWEDTQVLELTASARTGGDFTEAAYAALDY